MGNILQIYLNQTTLKHNSEFETNNILSFLEWINQNFSLLFYILMSEIMSS